MLLHTLIFYTLTVTIINSLEIERKR